MTGKASFFDGLRRISVRHFPWVLGAYFFLFALARVVSRPLAEDDEAKEIFLSQWWSWGYGIQPPLYTWMQKAAFEVLGTGLFAIGLVRSFWFFLIFFFTYRIARRSMGPERSVLASLLLFSCLPLMVYGFRATHTIQVSALITMTVFFWLRLLDRGRSRDYLLTGICAGLGLLSKYNFSLILLALGVATLAQSRGRARLRNSRSLITLASAMILLMPHAYWAYQNLDVLRGILGRELTPINLPYLKGVGKGLLKFATVSLEVLGPVLAFLILTGGIKLRSLAQQRVPKISNLSQDTPLIILTLAVSVCLNLLLILLGQVSDFHLRWLIPMIILFPAPLIQILEPEKKITRRMTRWSLILAIGILLFHSLRFRVEQGLDQGGRTHCDFRELYDSPALAGLDTSAILAQDYFFAGNLILNRHNAKVYCLESLSFEPLPSTLKFLARPDKFPEEVRPALEFPALYRSNCFAFYEAHLTRNETVR